MDNGVAEEPPIKIFVMGENRWRYEQEWPLARTQYTKYFFRSAGHANSLHGDGTLSQEAAGNGAPSDTYTYDPSDPVPTLGGANCCWSDVVPMGPFDQRPAEWREDVLVYTTPVLTEPLEVTGPISVKLFAATSAEDTDWTAKLVDVHTRGFAQNIQDGIVRARYRESSQEASLIQPDRVYEYTIDLWASSNTFLRGHRIRVEISSSNFPRFDRNQNTGGESGHGDFDGQGHADRLPYGRIPVAHCPAPHSQEQPVKARSAGASERRRSDFHWRTWNEAQASALGTST